MHRSGKESQASATPPPPCTVDPTERGCANTGKRIAGRATFVRPSTVEAGARKVRPQMVLRSCRPRDARVSGGGALWGRRFEPLPWGRYWMFIVIALADSWSRAYECEQKTLAHRCLPSRRPSLGARHVGPMKVKVQTRARPVAKKRKKLEFSGSRLDANGKPHRIRGLRHRVC